MIKLWGSCVRYIVRIQYIVHIQIYCTYTIYNIHHIEMMNKIPMYNIIIEIWWWHKWVYLLVIYYHWIVYCYLILELEWFIISQSYCSQARIVHFLAKFNLSCLDSICSTLQLSLCWLKLCKFSASSSPFAEYTKNCDSREFWEEAL